MRHPRDAILCSSLLLAGAAAWWGAPTRSRGAPGIPTASADEPPVPAPGGAGTEAIDEEWKRLDRPTREQYLAFLKRYRALGDAGRARAQAVAREMLERADPDDRTAHEVLGHREFAFEVPEEVSFRGYPFVRAVEEARERRWFDDAEAYARAKDAYERTKRHAARLQDDRVYRALDGARREVDRDVFLHDYVCEAMFAPPYLVCWADGERTNERAVARLPPVARAAERARFAEKRRSFRHALAERASIFRQAYAEFMRRYAEPCGLKDLMDEFGGRPDLPVAKRSFRDGCPLVAWTFSNKEAFADFHEKVKREDISPRDSGYLETPTGRLLLYEEGSGDREFDVVKCASLAADQLMLFFRRQRQEWGAAHLPHGFFQEGLRGYLGAVAMAPDRRLTFVGLNRPLLVGLLQIVDERNKAGGKMAVFPAKDLVGFDGHLAVVRWVNEHWGLWGAEHGLDVFSIQSWAFVYFLNEYADHKYRDAFVKYVADLLGDPGNVPNYGYEKFKAEFGIAGEDDWNRLDQEFRKFYLGTLAKTDLETIGKMPPARDDWPGYVEHDLPGLEPLSDGSPPEPSRPPR